MTDFSLPATAIAALILGSFYIWLTVRVILIRRKDGIILGDNNDRAVAKKIRGHANAAEQIPLGLILIGLNEALNSTHTAATIAVILILGRFMHGIYFTLPGIHHRYRVLGMFLTLIAQILSLLGLALGLLL